MLLWVNFLYLSPLSSILVITRLPHLMESTDSYALEFATFGEERTILSLLPIAWSTPD